jgi:hypothetical protein
MERSRRNVQSRTSKLAGVLADLTAAREGTGSKRASTFEVKQEDAVFDVVDEEQYEQLVAKRRLETGRRCGAALRVGVLGDAFKNICSRLMPPGSLMPQDSSCNGTKPL